MTPSLRSASVPLFLAFAACASPERPSPRPTASPVASAATRSPDSLRFDVHAVDLHADPCTDFYDFACGGWRATHPIPADRTRWSRYAELDAENLEHERDIVEGAAASGGSASPAEQRVGAYYAACLDEAAIESRGLAPMAEILASIAAMRTASEVAAVVEALHTRASYALFDFSVGPDPRDTRRTLAVVDEGKLGMGDAEAYRRPDDKARALRDKYRAHVAEVLKLLGSADPSGDAARVVSLETLLAASLPPPAERRDSTARIHPMTRGELQARAPAFDWGTYFAKMGSPDLGPVNVPTPAWLDAMNAALSVENREGLVLYFRYHLANGLKTFLTKAIDEAFFDFQQRTMRGAHAQPPRWKRCLGLVNKDVGDDVGRLFVARYFPRESRERATAIVRAVVATFRTELGRTEWLSAGAREEAVKKLDNHRFQVGYGDHWKSYDALLVDRNDAAGNAQRARALSVSRELATLGRPTDRDEFGELAQSVDGFGSKSLVSTGFTAGFLQPPVFDARMDDAVNFGGFAAVAGHELTHQFDDEGRKYDVDGNVRAWWSAEDVSRYEERARCFADEYARFHLDDGTAVDGKLTLGENIADNGGIRLAWDTAHPSPRTPKIDGYSAPQRFFLAWGQIRCENVTPEAARRQVESDPHSPGRWRVNGVVSNMPEFAEAFSCAAGAPMVPLVRCRVW
jgi:putative endopeptidase